MHGAHNVAIVCVANLVRLGLFERGRAREGVSRGTRPRGDGGGGGREQQIDADVRRKRQRLIFLI